MGEAIKVNVDPKGDRLIIAGSGNVALYIYKFAVLLGYRVTIIDDRAETLTWARFPDASDLLLGDIVELLKKSEISASTSVVLVTHNHRHDGPALEAIINSPARYIGVLGNRHKVAAYFNKLVAMDVAEELMEKIHLPIGLDIGGQLAAEIALAAVAEIQAVKYGRSGGFFTVKHTSGDKAQDEFF